MTTTSADCQRQALRRVLRRARKAAGLRQAEVAVRLGVPQSFVSKYEAGQRRLDLVDLRAVCAALQIDVGKLLLLFEAELKEKSKHEA